MTKEEFNKWKDRMAKFVVDNDFIVMARSSCRMVTVMNPITHKTGTAICHEDDEWDRNYGIVLAWCRCEGKIFPRITVRKKLSEMKNGERFYLRENKIARFIGKDKIARFIGKDKKRYVVRPEDTSMLLSIYDCEFEMVE